MPGPESQETARHALNPAAVTAWGSAALALAGGLHKLRGWARGRKPKLALASDLEALRLVQGQQAHELTETRDRVMQLPTRDDLREVRELLERGFDRMEAAGEARVAKLHERLDNHLEQHGRPAA